jgi:hypothetical protein
MTATELDPVGGTSLKQIVPILTVAFGMGLFLTSSASASSNLRSANAGVELADSQQSSTGPLTCPNGPCGNRSLPDFSNRRTVPEPATLTLVGLGLGAMALVRRNKRRTKN